MIVDGGNYKLYLGDCLDVMDKLIEQGVVFDAIIADIPYGTTACKWDSIIPFDEMWGRLNKLIKPNSAIVLFGSEPFSSALRMSNIKNYKYDWVWKKNTAGNFANVKFQPLKYSENIMVFSKKRHNYYPVLREASKDTKKRYSYGYNSSKRKDDCVVSMSKGYFKNEIKNGINKINPSNIIEFKKEAKNVHPTQKPIALMEYLIKTYTDENETVLDFTMGSGSTGVACMNTGRRFIGIELDENYFNIANERIESVI